jgi:hypothetical protein
MLPSPTPLAARPTKRVLINTMADNEALTSGDSWGAIAGGAFSISALSLLLLALGSGFGFSVVSPWTDRLSTAQIGSAAISWLILSEVAASCLGGYSPTFCSALRTPDRGMRLRKQRRPDF